MQHQSTPNPTMRPTSTGRSIVTVCTYKERQDVLRNTIIMDNKDEENPFSRNKTNIDKLYQNIEETTMKAACKISTLSSNELLQKSSVPFQTKCDVMEKSGQRKYPAFNGKTESQKPPSSPTPDYEPIQVRSIQLEQLYSGNNAASISGDTNKKREVVPLGAVTIGEYSQKTRKEPAKFDFLAQKNFKEEKNISNSEAASLRSELEDTLSRSNLKKASASSSSSSSASATAIKADTTSNDVNHCFEHQSHCQLHKAANIYGGNQHANPKEGTNIEKLTRLLQGKQEKDSSGIESVTSSTLRNQSANVRFENTGSGILKNGNNRRNNRISFAKNSEKSISFGN